MIQPILLFIFDSPTQILFVVAVIFLLFGASRLPQLAKSLGQTQKAFRDGLREAEEEERIEQRREIVSPSPASQVSAMSDDELMAEMRRRAEMKER